MSTKTLDQIVAEKPFADYAKWWPMGAEFLNFMSEAIVSEWHKLPKNNGSLARVKNFTKIYIQTVFHREARDDLVEDFVDKTYLEPILSGEFDALSYAFYRASFELIAQHIDQYDHPLARERRLYTKRVGKKFYHQVHGFLDLKLPSDLSNQAEFDQLQIGINTVGQFLVKQGYLRDHFRFTFNVHSKVENSHIQQNETDVLSNLHNHNLAYALYEMGYAVILPSAVYLYHTMGEAQHHSSRTIEELFDRVGYEARETDDFDPLQYPSDMVVELWEIRQLAVDNP
ncbi:MAG: hypothetical protein AAF629_34285 [Chloroflexota bacterium]